MIRTTELWICGMHMALRLKDLLFMGTYTKMFIFWYKLKCMSFADTAKGISLLLCCNRLFI